MSLLVITICFRDIFFVNEEELQEVLKNFMHHLLFTVKNVALLKLSRACWRRTIAADPFSWIHMDHKNDISIYISNTISSHGNHNEEIPSYLSRPCVRNPYTRKRGTSRNARYCKSPYSFDMLTSHDTPLDYH